MTRLVNFARGEDVAGRGNEFKKIFAGKGSGSGNAHGLQELAPVEIDFFGRDVGVGQFGFALQQHLLCAFRGKRRIFPILIYSTQL